MPIQSTDLIEVKQVRSKGRGVFARKFIASGTVFERCPVIVVPSEEMWDGSSGAVIQDYVFQWGRGTVALALGFGSMYNHSYQPNARYDDRGRLTKIFTALRDIQPGEEITINYNGDEDDQTPVWFDVAPEPQTSRKAANSTAQQDASPQLAQ